MEQGSLEELVLTRSVTKHIKKQNKDFVQGTCVGHDFARHSEIITAEALSDEPQLAWVKAFNNFYVSGGTPLMARLTLLLPYGIKEGRIKDYMKCFNLLAEDYEVQLAGGHSEVSKAYLAPSFVVTVIGKAGSYSHRKKLIKPGFEIIMTGYAAMYGTDFIVDKKKNELLTHFPVSYVDEKTPWEFCYSIKKAADILACNEDVYYMHDVSHGGIYAALWQLGAYCSRGISIGHYSIPILQSTIEFCEFFGLNPYILEGTGALIAVVGEGCGVDIVNMLSQNGINASVIGRVEKNNERMVYLGEALAVSSIKDNPDEAVFFKNADNKYIDRRCLTPVKSDEIYKIGKR